LWSFYPANGVEQSGVLKLKFGLVETGFYEEKKATWSENSSLKTSAEKEALYRFFATTQALKDKLTVMTARHLRLWEILKKESGKQAFSMDQDAYSQEVQKRDPYLFGLINPTAPRLYFDFTSLSGNQYNMLEAIEVRTIAFEEYRDGGFFNSKAEYNIRLRHIPGTHTYPIGRRLVFTGNGHAVIFFSSDNWYPKAGMTPQGCYLIDITFIFTVDGNKTERVSTGAFKIDV
jgi:hypothetical protein